MFCIEGPDAVGKNTQSKLLAEKFNAKLISFPRYATEIGQAIRGSVMGEWAACVPNGDYEPDDKINFLARQALFLLDRYDAASEIENTLNAGTNVVLDRYWPSGVIFGASDGLDEQMLIRAHIRLPQPDIFILLHVPLEEGFRRRPERRDLYERSPEKMEDVRLRYFELFVKQQADRLQVWTRLEEHQRTGDCQGMCCDKCPAIARPLYSMPKWVVVDGVGTIEEVHNRILGVIS